jgi:hypothetical protein
VATAGTSTAAATAAAATPLATAAAAALATAAAATAPGTWPPHPFTTAALTPPRVRDASASRALVFSFLFFFGFT